MCISSIYITKQGFFSIKKSSPNISSPFILQNPTVQKHPSHKLTFEWHSHKYFSCLRLEVQTHLENLFEGWDSIFKFKGWQLGIDLVQILNQNLRAISLLLSQMNRTLVFHQICSLFILPLSFHTPRVELTSPHISPATWRGLSLRHKSEIGSSLLCLQAHAIRDWFSPEFFDTAITAADC